MYPSNKKIVILISGVLLSIIYCEFLIYYIVIAQCDWLPVKNYEAGPEVLKALIISDTHLLGPRKSFRWVPLDKWRRDWELHQSFKVIIALHNPEVVFILGDIFDEGEFSSDEQFKDYVERFHKTFPLPHYIKLFITVGNHDIGFHNNIHRGSVERFAKLMNSPSVQLLTLKNCHFVLINSMALEGDTCQMCTEARNKINNISGTLQCSANHSRCKAGDYGLKINYSQPILLQHFPLYRLSDAVCTEPDAAPPTEKYTPFRLKIDALSKEATEDVVFKIKPRAVFGGHTHYGCLLHRSYSRSADGGDVHFYEHSVPSFSMGNIVQPKYMLVTITPDAYAANKCSLPGETIIYITYAVLLAVTLVAAHTRRIFGRGVGQVRKYCYLVSKPSLPAREPPCQLATKADERGAGTAKQPVWGITSGFIEPGETQKAYRLRQTDVLGFPLTMDDIQSGLLFLK